MRSTLQDAVDKLESYLPELERTRTVHSFANDVFEAADDLRHLAHRAIEGDTRVNYPARAREESELWKKLMELLQRRPGTEQERLAPVFDTALEILPKIEEIHPSKEGHLGIVKTILELFEFLQTDFGFAIQYVEPTGVQFSSGAVYIKLQWATAHSLSCSFGSEAQPKKSFWIDDLLFLYHDPSYRTIPEKLKLNTREDVERWLTFLAEVFKQYGRDMLTDQPGVFEELARAQMQRDHEYTEETSRPDEPD
jgi:hypothetical protein